MRVIIYMIRWGVDDTMGEEEEMVTCHVKDLKDGYWDSPDGILEISALTDMKGEQHKVVHYDYLGQTDFSPLVCKMCDFEVDDSQIILKTESGWWVVPHRSCDYFVWYKEEVSLE